MKIDNDIDGKPAVIKTVLRMGGSRGIHLPLEWLSRNSFPKFVSITTENSGKYLVVKPYDGKWAHPDD